MVILSEQILTKCNIGIDIFNLLLIICVFVSSIDNVSKIVFRLCFEETIPSHEIGSLTLNEKNKSREFYLY